ILPKQIELNAKNELWAIRYEPCQKKFRIIKKYRELVLIGDLKNQQACREVLISWIKNQAHSFLMKQLNTISQKINLPYQNFSFRDQKTRWGSCSADKNISLNYKLIFFPLELVSHIIIHELCHTRHMNHSKKFWNLVSQCDINYDYHRCLLRKANDF